MNIYTSIIVLVKVVFFTHFSHSVHYAYINFIDLHFVNQNDLNKNVSNDLKKYRNQFLNYNIKFKLWSHFKLSISQYYL